MNSSELLPVYSDFIEIVFNASGINESLYYVFNFALKYIPADKIICNVINRNMKIRNIIEYNKEDDKLQPSLIYIKRLLPILNIRSLINFKDNSISIIQDTKDYPELYDSITMNNDMFRSSMVLFLYLSDQADTVVSINFTSIEPNKFNDEHATIISIFKKPLENLIARDLLQLGDYRIFMPGKNARHTMPEDLLRQSKGLSKVMRQIEAIAPRSFPVLINGPSGVGKELVMESIHNLSKRKGGPLIRVNCGAIPESLMDSALFGHEKGAFTGAHASQVGYFEQAQGGTLYLDEIGELSPAAQVRLLRVLENREVSRIGGRRSVPIDVRIIAATHRDLHQMVLQGSFREDLWYRLNVYPINIPPLSQRLEDIPVLIEHFYHAHVVEQELSLPPHLTNEFIMDLSARDWPGNARQLRYTVDRALIASVAEGLSTLRLAEEDLQPDLSQSPNRQGRPVSKYLSTKQIIDAMENSGGRIQGAGGAASILGVSPSTLRNRMKSLGIPLPNQNLLPFIA